MDLPPDQSETPAAAAGLPHPTQAEAATAALGVWLAEADAPGADGSAAARAVAPRLGAIPQADGTVAFVAWVPALVREQVADADLHLEVFDALEPLDLTAARTERRFQRTLVPARRHQGLAYVVVEGLTIGSSEQVGSLYRWHLVDRMGQAQHLIDPMAASMPFGAFAPSEVYDIAGIPRSDGDYWAALAEQARPDRTGRNLVKQRPTTNILQIHVPTATAGGTIASLARWFANLAAAVRRGGELTPHEQSFLGYDAVQLMPVEPTTVYEAGPAFWTVEEEPAFDPASGGPPAPHPVTVTLRRPNTTNWGYDVVIAGGAAVNPVLLEHGRPDELVDLAGVLHTFPGRPIRLIADVVYGHADNQALGVLDVEWFAGPNMYGQDMAYRKPWVRAQLLEMQRRKVSFGFDGVRVDGAQDFKFYDPDQNRTFHDDAFLQEMSDVVQSVGGCDYRPWMIFEDGRPWPQPDWELSSTYRAVIEAQPDDDVFQWGPLTFAHNTPFVVGFWLEKWWRIRQIAQHGSNWISGCANHDTLRRGTQVSPDLYINERLGATRLEILDKAYDNPAITMLTYCAFPGVPMDFVNASMRAAWGFIRNTDDRYGVKVVAEEVVSLRWQVNEEAYGQAHRFRRLKDLGFETLPELQRFMDLLPALVSVTDYDLATMAHLCGEVDPPLAGPEEVTPDVLKTIAHAWMDDMHDYSNVIGWVERLSGRQTAYNLAVREFRQAREWLRGNLAATDQFDYLEPVDGKAVFACLRTSPDGAEQVLVVANMEGSDAEMVPTEVDLPGLTPDGWSVALRTPNIGGDYLGGPIVLNDSSGVVFTRPAPG